MEMSIGTRNGLSRLVAVALFGSAIAFCPAPRSNADETAGGAVESDVREAIPVLGRILEKDLKTQGVPTGLQWVYLKGRGLLYFGGVDLSHLGRAGDDSQRNLSEDERVWENARRETLGQPPVKIDESQRIRGAVDAVRASLTRFAGRVPLPGGEEVRVALYEKSSGCMGCHARSSSNAFFLGLEDAKKRGYALNDAHNLLSAWTTASSGGSAGHHHFLPRSALVIDQRGSMFQAKKQQLEDVTVLARVLGKKLASAFPDEYWGFDMQGRAGSMGLTVGDWGPVVILNMTFPLEEKGAIEGSRRLDLWEQTVRELRGQRQPRSALDAYEKVGPKNGRKLAVDASAFLATVKDVIATFGSRVRGLERNQEIVVAVFGGSTPIVANPSELGVLSPGFLETTLSRDSRILTSKQRFRAGTSPSYVLRLEASDVLPGPDGVAPGTKEVVGKIRVE